MSGCCGESRDWHGLSAYKHTRDVGGRQLLPDFHYNMSSAVSVVALLSVLALVAAGGYEGEVGNFGGHLGGGEEGGFGGGEAGGLDGGEGLGGGGGAEHHDLKGYAFSYVNVHKPKTFTVPVYKYVLHDEHHGEQGGAEQGGAGGGDFGGHEGFGGGQEDFGHHY